MKKVASSVKLELAQYRELASFSQFGSDVDQATKDRLEHGRLLMEILKQPQYNPVPVENQVMLIYAAINHHLKEISIDQVKDFEEGFYEFMDIHHAIVGKTIRETGELSAEAEEELKKGIEVYKKEFLSI